MLTMRVWVIQAAVRTTRTPRSQHSQATPGRSGGLVNVFVDAGPAAASQYVIRLGVALWWLAGIRLGAGLSRATQYRCAYELLRLVAQRRLDKQWLG
ncbi:MAG: hypothetical protein ACI9S9_002434 [Planctomycetota bacterium]|jgi:hypothetical protein